MTKHIIDRKRDGSDAARLKAYVPLARDDAPHPASRDLMQRASDDDSKAGERLKAFLRIERGRTA
jgi:hypothetical protein